MKIAVTAWQLGSEGAADELARQAETAEALGFDSFWLPESHFTGSAAIPQPLLLLAAIASRTSRIRLGTTSYLLPIRHPILAAEEVAVLDRLSSGRLILGIGRGFQDAMFHVFNIPTKDKRKIFKTNLDQMIAAWQGEPIPIEGADPITLSPLPVQQPHPPLWVAAFGPLAIKQAGTLGLPYIASPVEDLSTLADNVTQHRSHMSNAGHEAPGVTPIMRTVFVTDRPAMHRQVIESLSEEAVGRRFGNGVHPDDWAIVGDTHQVRDKLQEYSDQLGMDYLIARGRIRGVEDQEQIRSHELLMTLAD